MRFETNPGESRASAGTFPRSSASATIAARVSCRRLVGADHLDQLQDRHGIEEVHADHLRRPTRGRSERRDRDGGCVRGENRLSREHLVSPFEEILLDGRVLDDSLDHEVGRDEISDDLHPREDVSRVLAALRGELLQTSPHGFERVLGRTGERVME